MSVLKKVLLFAFFFSLVYLLSLGEPIHSHGFKYYIFLYINDHPEMFKSVFLS